MSGSDNKTRYQRELLPSNSVGNTRTLLLDFRGDEDGWHVIEARSTSALPFELELCWSLSGGSGASARVTITNASRVSFFGKSVSLFGRNLSQSNNEIQVMIGDGYAPSVNVLEVLAASDGKNMCELMIPLFSHSLHVDAPEPHTLNDAYAAVLDGNGAPRATMDLARQPERGLLLGGGSRVRLSSTQSATFRIIFHLNM